MALPTITLSATINPDEIWDMLWEIALVLNGNLTMNGNFDFGLDNDEATNVSHHKIHWGPGGHDHGTYGPVIDELAQPNFDYNSLNILWFDFFSRFGEKGVPSDVPPWAILAHGTINVSVTSGVGTGTLPSVITSNLLDYVNDGYYDSGWDALLPYIEVGGYIIGIPDYFCATTDSIYVWRSGSSYYVKWSTSASDGTYAMNFMVWFRRNVDSERYLLTLTVTGSGVIQLVAPDTGRTWFEAGEDIYLNAIADPGNHFVEWTGDLTGSTNPEYLVMTSNKSVGATFEPNP